MRAVNLLPRDEQRARFEGAKPPFLIAAGGVVLVTIAATLLSFSAAGTADEREAQIADVERQIAELPKAPRSEVSQGTLVRERADRTTALAAALTTRVPFDRLLREISYVFPRNAWLTQFEATAPEAALPEGGGAPPPPQTQQEETPGVTIQGAAFTHEGVATVLTRLALVPSLENVQLTASVLVEPQAEAANPTNQGPAAPTARTRAHVTFIVTASLKTGAGQ
jgi:Tfp pilus assembly protein PilN